MPLRKQPSSLRCLAQEALLVLGEGLWQSAFSNGLKASLLEAPALRTYLAKLQSAVDHSLTTSLIERLEESLISLRRHLRIRSFLEALFPALLNNKVTALDICFKDPMIQDCIIKTLPKFSSLHTLRVGCKEVNALQESIDDIVKSVPCFSCITDLCVLGICNRNLLSKVSSTCRLLRSLDIRYSIAITDEDTACLTVCKSLQRIDFYGTSCTSHSVSVLLGSLPLLSDIGAWDQLNDVIRSVTSRDQDIHHLNLTRFVTNQIPAVFLQSICRNITEVCLTMASISPPDLLPVFNNLRKLTVDLPRTAAGVNLFHCFGIYFTTRLHELRFSSSFVGKKDLAYLSYCAPYLKSLELRDLVKEQDILKPYPRFSFNFLLHVQVVDVPLSLVETLMKRSFALESISICLRRKSKSLITDDWMASILSSNPLRRLNKLSIQSDNTLTMLTVRSLINKCSALKWIDTLSTWGGITFTELEDFRREIRRNNLALIIDSSGDGCGASDRNSLPS